MKNADSLAELSFQHKLSTPISIKKSYDPFNRKKKIQAKIS